MVTGIKVGFTYGAQLLVILYAGQNTGAGGVVVANPGIAEDKKFNLLGTAALSGDRTIAVWS